MKTADTYKDSMLFQIFMLIFPAERGKEKNSKKTEKRIFFSSIWQKLTKFRAAGKGLPIFFTGSVP